MIIHSYAPNSAESAYVLLSQNVTFTGIRIPVLFLSMKQPTTRLLYILYCRCSIMGSASSSWVPFDRPCPWGFEPMTLALKIINNNCLYNIVFPVSKNSYTRESVYRSFVFDVFSRFSRIQFKTCTKLPYIFLLLEFGHDRHTKIRDKIHPKNRPNNCFLLLVKIFTLIFPPRKITKYCYAHHDLCTVFQSKYDLSV